MNSFVRNFNPPLAAEVLRTCNFFELYPFDGGGNFIHRALVGSVDDREIVRKIRAEHALDDFGSLEKLDFLKFERWASIEKSCWINRMYFIVPLARVAMLDRDRELAQTVRHIILDFARRYPAPRTREDVCDLEVRVKTARDRDYNGKAGFDGPTEYQWFDFQPASRIIHMLHAAWFLRELDVLSDDDYAQLDELIAEHARTICETERFATKPAPGNHQALRAGALLAAGYAFMGDPRAEDWLDEAVPLFEYHILHDFLPDGMNIDLSPSYHFFETWICRDAAICAARCGRKFSDDANERMRRAFAVCRALRLPDGRTPVISDGYPLDMAVFAGTLPENGQAECPRIHLEYAKIAIRRENDSYMLFDCAPLLNTLAHYHAGKQSFTLFLGGKPFVIDGGCCNYDNPDFWNFFKQARAHSTLIVDGHGDGLLEGRYTWRKAASTQLEAWHRNAISSRECSAAPGWENVLWQRTLDMDARHCRVQDQIEFAPGEQPAWRLQFILSPDGVLSATDTGFRLVNGSVEVDFTSSVPARIVKTKCVRDFDVIPTHMIVLEGTGSAEVEADFTLIRS